MALPTSPKARVRAMMIKRKHVELNTSVAANCGKSTIQSFNRNSVISMRISDCAVMMPTRIPSFPIRRAGREADSAACGKLRR